MIVYGDSEDLSDRVGVITFNFSDVNSHLAATDSSTYWSNYAANLKTYITVRSLWFHNNFSDQKEAIDISIR